MLKFKGLAAGNPVVKIFSKKLLTDSGFQLTYQLDGMLNRIKSAELSETKRKLVDAGVKLMRARGYTATTVDDICADAGVTKGGFFHYFKSKDDIARAALTHFHEGKLQDYEGAAFRKQADPLDRVFGRLDFVKETVGPQNRVTKGCLIGMFAQELAVTNPEIRDVCQNFFARIIRDFSHDLAEAKAVHAPDAKFDPKAVAQFYVSIVQGSLMLAKVAGGNDVLHSNLEQFREHLKFLFGLTGAKQTAKSTDKSRN
jgi:TetR/AcrR family transcriptional regulator, transcriptional repressor for nem operon